MGRSGSDTLNQVPPLAYETHDDDNFQDMEASQHALPPSEPHQPAFEQQPPPLAYNNFTMPPPPNAIQSPPHQHEVNGAVQFPPPNPHTPPVSAAAYDAQGLPSAMNFPPEANYGQPPPGYAAGIPMPHQGGNQQGYWSSGLFDCMENPENAITTAFFPCVTFGQIAEIIDNGHSTCTVSGFIYSCAMYVGVPWIMSCSYRTKLRSRYGLTEVPAQDWLIHLMCGWCALCQEYRELQHRGFDPSIGLDESMPRGITQ